MYPQTIVSEKSRTSASSELCLWFSKEPYLTLDRTMFRANCLPDTILAVRGKSPGAYVGAATFQWYLGPQALIVFLLRAASRNYSPVIPVLEGGVGSLAACLDMIIEKSSSWIYDIFGCKADGTPLIKRILRRRNAGRRRGGDVAFSLNDTFLPPENIRVFVDGVPVTDKKELFRLSEEVEFLWLSKKTQLRASRAEGVRVAKAELCPLLWV